MKKLPEASQRSGQVQPSLATDPPSVPAPPAAPPPPSPSSPPERQAPTADTGGKKKPKKATRTVTEGVANSSTARSSAIMFAGTLVSRGLGFVRQWLLVLAIGGFGVADAFNTANTLPNTLYNLVAGGVLNAILVPWIVRALLRNKAGDQQGTAQVNALLTLASMVLLGLTLLTMALVGPLVLLFSAHISPDLLPLTMVFALWCLPQIFFYGLYALWGQVLNSLSNFGPYMWAPVLNNVVGIAGLSVFVYLYGAAPATDHNVAAWDFGRIALLAGSMTLGIALQALVLVIALRYFGFYLRLNFHFRGLGLRQTSKVAGWAFAALLATTVSNIVVTRVGTAANGWGIAHDTFVVSTAIYGYANMLYMLPQSLITTSITTAIFTKMAYRATHGDMLGLARDYSSALRLSGMFTVGLAALMIVAALPLTYLTASNLPPAQANAMAVLLGVFCLGIPFQGIYTTNSRVFYALEDTRPQFFITLPLMLVTVSAALLTMTFAPAQYWVYACAAGEAAGLAVAALLGVWSLHRRGLPLAVFWQCLVSFIRFTAAALGAATLTWFTLLAVGMGSDSDWTVGSHLRQGLLLCVVAGLVMSVSYVALLWILRSPEVLTGIRLVAQKLGLSARRHLPNPAAANPAAASPAGDVPPSGSPTTLNDGSEPANPGHSGQPGDLVDPDDPVASRSVGAPTDPGWAVTAGQLSWQGSTLVLPPSFPPPPERTAHLLQQRRAEAANATGPGLDSVNPNAHPPLQAPTGQAVAEQADQTILEQSAAALDLWDQVPAEDALPDFDVALPTGANEDLVPDEDLLNGFIADGTLGDVSMDNENDVIDVDANVDETETPPGQAAMNASNSGPVSKGPTNSAPADTGKADTGEADTDDYESGEVDGAGTGAQRTAQAQAAMAATLAARMKRLRWKWHATPKSPAGGVALPPAASGDLEEPKVGAHAASTNHQAPVFGSAALGPVAPGAPATDHISPASAASSPVSSSLASDATVMPDPALQAPAEPAGGASVGQQPTSEQLTSEQPRSGGATVGGVSATPATQADSVPGEVNQVHRSLASLHERRGRESRLLLGAFVLALGVIVALSALVLATRPRHEAVQKDSSLHLEHTDKNIAAAPQAPPEPIALTEAQAANPQGDTYDHPELAPNAIDGNPQTMWRTVRLITAKQRPGNGYALTVKLEKPTVVREVRVFSPCQGGMLELHAPAEQLGQGEKLGEQPYGDQVTFSLDKPRELSEVVLWTNVLPTAPGGGNQIVISEVQVLG